MSSKKLLVVNTAYYGIIPSIPKMVNILLLPILTQYLTAEDYGIAGTIVAYTSALSAFNTLGCASFLTSSYYHYGARFIKIWRQVYGLLQYWMIIFAVVQAILLYFVIPEAAHDNRWAIIILTNFNNVLFGPAALLGNNYYRLVQEPKPIVYRSLIGGLLTAFANLFLIAYLNLGYVGWYVSSFVGMFVVNASYWYSLNYRLKLTPNYWLNKNVVKHAIRVSLPTIPHYYSAYLINGSNKFLMDQYRISLSQIGRFNFASEFYSYFELFGSAVNSAISPMFMQAIKEGKDKDSRKIFMQSLIFFVLAVSLFVIWSREIFIVMVRNGDLADSYIIASVLISGFIHRPVYLAISSAMFYHEKTSSLMKISLVSGLSSLILYSIFIPIYGIWAAAIITYIALTLMGYLGYVYPSTKKLYDLPCNVWMLFIILNLIVFVSLFLADVSVMIKLFLTVLLLNISFLLFKRL